MAVLHCRCGNLDAHGDGYFADEFARPKQPRASTADFRAGNHHAIVQRANAQYAKMESVMNTGLSSLGFKQRRGVFFIDC
jgi:hypothetical protein